MPEPTWDRPWNRQIYIDATGLPPVAMNVGYLGVKPYRPRPLQDGVKDVLVPYPEGTPQLAFECKELSAAFLWEVYREPAYKANGSEIVQNYRGTRLVKCPNDKLPPAPQPGDVLAYGLYPPGHTSVCIFTAVDSNGNGAITVMEQNNSKSGQRTLPVRQWQVQASPPVTGWLHYPGEIIVPTPPTTPNTRYFPETGHNLSNAFKAFWEAEPKALLYFGFPISEERREVLSDGHTYVTQAFERARFEYHPEAPEGQQVQLGRIGAELELVRADRHV